MTKALVILLAIAIVLGVIAYFAVFTPGTYEFASSNNASSSSSGTLSFNSLANGNGGNTASGTGQNATTTAGPLGNAASGTYGSTYTYPYVMSWNEGQNDFSVTGAAFDGTNLTLAVKVQVGNVGGCIPVDVRLVTDESGDVEAPNQSQFTFPDTNSCNGTPNTAYTNQILTFPIAVETPTPWLFTTGGTSNQFFQITTSSDGGIQLALPATSD